MLLRGETHTDSLFRCCNLTLESASVILDKFRCFPTIPLLAESCEALAERAEYPTDQHLPQIVDLLRMIEDIESLVKGTTHFQLEDNLLARIENLQRQLRSLKAALPSNVASSRE